MPLILNEEQNMLQQAAKEFCSKHAPVSQLRKLRDEQSETGFDRATWQQMVDLGWAGITVPEAFGGLGFGFKGLGVVLQECGRTLTASPLLSSALGTVAILQGGSEAVKAEVLEQVASGELLLALAAEESAHHKPYKLSALVEKAADGYIISGEKSFVLDGHTADKIVVVGRTSGAPGDRDGITLLLVDAGAQGLTITRTSMLDSRNAADIKFEKTPGTLLGEEGKGADILDRVLDTGRILLSAEMLGGVEECFERTLEYLKVREQFGAAIGSFQSLKHRAANMFCEVELAKSVVLEALSALDEDNSQLAALASLAKARLNDTYHLVTSEGIQMHGGIGITDEHEIGFFLKRSRVCEQTFGNSAFHSNRFAELNGY